MVVRNASNANITAVIVDLTFPETGTGAVDSPMISSGGSFGRLPDLAFRHKDGTVGPIMARPPRMPLRPGELAEIVFQTNVEAVEKEIAKNTQQVHHVDIRINTLYFDDKVKWSPARGDVYLPVPAAKLWRLATAEEAAAYQARSS
jgi:hypothetical protein